MHGPVCEHQLLPRGLGPGGWGPGRHCGSKAFRHLSCPQGAPGMASSSLWKEHWGRDKRPDPLNPAVITPSAGFSSWTGAGDLGDNDDVASPRELMHG